MLPIPHFKAGEIAKNSDRLLFAIYIHLDFLFDRRGFIPVSALYWQLVRISSWVLPW